MHNLEREIFLLTKCQKNSDVNIIFFYDFKNKVLEESKTMCSCIIAQKKMSHKFVNFLFSLPISYIFADVMLSCCDGYYDKDIWHNVKFSDLTKFINLEGRYECPRSNCSKHYKDASSLQRHIR